MTTTTTPPDITTAIPCPSWCTVDHSDMPPGAGFHAGSGLVGAKLITSRLWQTDQVGTRPGVVIAGQFLSEAEAHELGMSLVRASDVLRREANR